MTGRYNYRTGVVDTFKGRSMMNPEEVTVAQILRDSGYATGIFGKWHLGDCYPMRPIDRGFDEELTLRGGGLGQNSEPIENHRHYTNPILIQNGKEVWTTGYCTNVFFDAAFKFIDSSRAKGKPFFIYLATNAPHRPVDDVPMDLYEKYRHKDLSRVLLGNTADADYVARVYAMEENIDQNVGRLQAKLKSVSLLENTIVIYLSDNGPDSYRWVGPFRGKKTEVWEGGVRTPFFIQWVGHLQPGIKSDRLVGNIDILPTLLEAAGAPAPEGLKLDGRSFWGLLNGRDSPWPDRTMVVQEHRGDVPIRYHNFEIRDQSWKLVHATGFANEVMPSGVPFQLYKIGDDVAERKDVSAQYPEVAAALLKSYDAWFDDVSSTRPNTFAPSRIILGNDNEVRTVLTRQDWRVTSRRGADGDHGKWLLNFEGEHTYNLRFVWPSTVKAGELKVSIGSYAATAAIKEATNSFEVRGVRIGPGNAELEAVVQHPNSAPDEAYQIIVTRS